MGQKVGYELWEEIGFYEGFAKVWKIAGEGKLLDAGGEGELKNNKSE